jgi:hypothetical protein
MKQLLLASALIALPTAGFTVFQLMLPGTPPAMAAAGAESLGNLSAYATIISDTRTLARKGDFGAAEKRITDFETRWDAAEATLRPKAPAAWGDVDAAADDSFAALRAPRPDAGAVETTLAALSLALTDPAGTGDASGSVSSVAGVAVTDTNGHAIPCEAMLADLRKALADGSIPTAYAAAASGLQAKATERCNADDDAHADALSAQALALAGN